MTSGNFSRQPARASEAHAAAVAAPLCSRAPENPRRAAPTLMPARDRVLGHAASIGLFGGKRHDCFAGLGAVDPDEDRQPALIAIVLATGDHNRAVGARRDGPRRRSRGRTIGGGVVGANRPPHRSGADSRSSAELGRSSTSSSVMAMPGVAVYACWPTRLGDQ